MLLLGIKWVSNKQTLKQWRGESVVERELLGYRYGESKGVPVRQAGSFSIWLAGKRLPKVTCAGGRCFLRHRSVVTLTNFLLSLIYPPNLNPTWSRTSLGEQCGGANRAADPPRALRACLIPC